MPFSGREPFENVRHFIELHSMLEGASGVVVGVSGGPDSVALLDMLVRLTSGTDGRSPIHKLRLHVAHLDHLLRGHESTEDADFVRALADRQGLAVTMASVDVRAEAEARGRGIEEIAREIRYDFFSRVANETGCDRIAVGHTMTDQAETFMMRLIRGAGLRGLAAMRPVVPAHEFGIVAAEEQRSRGAERRESSSTPPLLRPSAPLLIRPLLSITRDEVEAYCRERGLEFRTDQTNLTGPYTRTRIRRDVLPALEAINPQVVKAIARAVDNLANDQEVLDNLAAAFLDQARLHSTDATGLHDQRAAAYSVRALLEKPIGMRRRMIIEAIRLAHRTADRKSRDNAGEVVSSHVKAVERLLKPDSSGRHINLPGLEVWREFDAVVLMAVADEEAPYECPISSANPCAEAGGFAFSLQRGEAGKCLKVVVEEAQREKRRVGRDWMIVALDNKSLPDPLLIKPRERGQRAHVKGQRKTKKLKNLMIDHRIPSSRRANWPLVTTPDGRYVWSPGLPPALEFAAGDETQDLAIMRASSI